VTHADPRVLPPRRRPGGRARLPLLLVSFLAAAGGCIGGGDDGIALVAGEVPYRTLGPRTHRLEIDGASREAVRETFGAPRRRADGPVAYPRNGLPGTIPDYDEQWVYTGLDEQTLIYFEDGHVVLAIHEWAPR
jgi:hypothetical protein